MGRPARVRVTVTSAVSNTGTATIVSGTNNTDTRLPEAAVGEDTARPANAEPRKRLPASPMKMEAGGKLYRKNPSAAPPSAQATEACNQAPLFANVMPRKTDATAVTPAASPSMTSRSSKALVTPANQNSAPTTCGPYQGLNRKT